FPGKGRTASQENRQRAATLSAQASEKYQGNDPSFHLEAAILTAGAGMRTEFNRVKERLNSQSPKHWGTHYINAIGAAMDNDRAKIEREVNVARSLGMPAEVAQGLLDSTADSTGGFWHYLYYSLSLVGIWLIGLAALFVLGKVFSAL